MVALMHTILSQYFHNTFTILTPLMSRQLEVLIHGLGHNDLAASSRVLLRQVFGKGRDVWGRFYVRIWWRQVLHLGFGKTAVSSFSMIFSWSPPSVGGGRRFWQNYISSKSSSGWTNTFTGDQEKRVVDAEQFAGGAGDVPAQVCAFVLFFIRWHFFLDCGCTSPSPMSTSARPKRRVWKSCSKNTGSPKMSIDGLD